MAGESPRWVSNRHTMKADLMWEFCLDKEVGERKGKMEMKRKERQGPACISIRVWGIRSGQSLTLKGTFDPA